MDTALRSNKGFAEDDDEDEDDFGKETSSSHKDGGKDKNEDTEQKPSTPRSKHSATEQRRRSRINERFHILRELIPHSDQKRDKASFLLEVIEYIQFLHEKVQKYEMLNPGWNPDGAKLMPWYPPVGADSGVSPPHQRLIYDTENMVAQPQVGWPRSGPTDSSVGCDILTRQEELVIDEGTISLSSMYSDRLLTTLTQALQSTGIDLSQASISVQISLGRQAICRPMFGLKDQDDPTSGNKVVGQSRVMSSGRESEDANKRPRSDTS